MNQVLIMEITKFGIPAFQAQCPACGWHCHNHPHEAQETAVRCAERHNENHH
jgi:hypothetical protein